MIETGIKEKGAEYYNNIYKDAEDYKCGFEKSPYYNVWFELIGFLPEFKQTLIVDAGCGTGQLLSMLEYYNYTNLVGIDFSDVAIQMANDKTESVVLFNDNINKIRFKADVIVCTEVLEHIENDIETVKSWDAKQIILTVPNFPDPAHVRYFESAGDVGLRYGELFKSYQILQVEKWFILNGNK